MFYLENSSQVWHFYPVDVYIFLKEKEVPPGNFLCKTNALGGRYAVFSQSFACCLVPGARTEVRLARIPGLKNVRRPLSQCQSWVCMTPKMTTPYTVYLCLPQPPPSPCLVPHGEPHFERWKKTVHSTGKRWCLMTLLLSHHQLAPVAKCIKAAEGLTEPLQRSSVGLT